MSDAYHLRLEVLKIAKEILEHDYFMRRDMGTQLWHVQCEIAKARGENPPLPEEYHVHYPSTTDILIKAKELNRFISERQ